MRALLAVLAALICAWGGAGAHAAAGTNTPSTADTRANAGTHDAPGAISYPAVVPGRPLAFPADLGSHPAFRTEWWYVTGWLETDAHHPLGFQVTFFRTRPDIDERNPSALAPRQLLIAHCALSDPSLGHLLHDQRIRRAGLSLAEAAEGDTRVWIDDWSLEHRAGTYAARIAAEDFTLALDMRETQAPMANGVAGFSRKGPAETSASHYYSVPHLSVSGIVTRGRSSVPVRGEAWLDHEWSSEYLDSEAAGWDWLGLNLDDGGALMAFRIRGLDGTQRWAGATWREPSGSVHVFGPTEVAWRQGRAWISPRTAVAYPVQWRVSVGTHEIELGPLLDDQENDARLSTGAIYWEGAVRAYQEDRETGRGYLELTGYGERLKLR